MVKSNIMGKARIYIDGKWIGDSTPADLTPEKTLHFDVDELKSATAFLATVIEYIENGTVAEVFNETTYIKSLDSYQIGDFRISREMFEDIQQDIEFYKKQI
jgi:hypothetical protein